MVTQFSNYHLRNKQEIRATSVSCTVEKKYQVLSGPTAAAGSVTFLCKAARSWNYSTRDFSLAIISILRFNTF